MNGFPKRYISLRFYKKREHCETGLNRKGMTNLTFDIRNCPIELVQGFLFIKGSFNSFLFQKILDSNEKETNCLKSRIYHGIKIYVKILVRVRHSKCSKSYITFKLSILRQKLVAAYKKYVQVRRQIEVER